MAAENPRLRYRSMWLLIGYSLIAVIVYLSLSGDPIDIDTELPYQDKLFHALAYFGLTFWFMQLYHLRRHRLRWVIVFLCLGLLLEYLQGFEPQRYSEVGDMVANALGVTLAMALSATRLRFLLVHFEQFIQR